MWLYALDTKIYMVEFKVITEADKFCDILEQYRCIDGK